MKSAMKSTITCLLATSLVLTGCASAPSNHAPLVDRPGANYYQDLKECNAHADKVHGAAEQAVGGAVAGALVGAAFAGLMGVKGWRNESAAAYGLAGALGGAVKGDSDQRSVVRNCLRGRGYNVLN